MASILQGTPIQTSGIHPLTAIMAQGGDILSRGYEGASRQMGRNTAMTLSFLRDAASERIEFQRQKLEKEKMMLHAELQREEMEQRERMHSEGLAARERMAGMRAAGGGRRGSAGASGIGQPDISGLLGSIFQHAGGGAPIAARQAPTEALISPQAGHGLDSAGNTIHGGPMAPGQQDQGNFQVQQNLADADNKLEDKSMEVARTNLNLPENSDNIQRILEAKVRLGAVRTATAPTQGTQITGADRTLSAMLELEKHKQARASGGDANGVAMVADAVKRYVSPFDGFTGVHGSGAAEIDAAAKADPTKKEALTMLDVDSNRLRWDLTKADPDLDKISGLLDVYSDAARTIDRQVKEASFVVAEQSKSDGPGIKLVDSYVSENQTVNRIREHKKTLEEVFLKTLERTDLSKQPPRNLSTALVTTNSQLSSAKEAAAAAEEFELMQDKRIKGILGSEWNQEGLNKVIEKEYDPETRSYSAKGQTLREEKAVWMAARAKAEAARQDIKKWEAKKSTLEGYGAKAGWIGGGFQEEPKEDPNEAFWDQPRKGAEFMEGSKNPDAIKSSVNHALEQARRKREELLKSVAPLGQ